MQSNRRALPTAKAPRQTQEGPAKPLLQDPCGQLQSCTPAQTNPISELHCWAGNNTNTIMKSSHSPTQDQPNPQKNRLKVAFGPLFPTRNIFRGLGLVLYRKQTTRNLTQPKFSANTLLSRKCYPQRFEGLEVSMGVPAAPQLALMALFFHSIRDGRKPSLDQPDQRPAGYSLQSRPVRSI